MFHFYGHGRVVARIRRGSKIAYAGEGRLEANGVIHGY